MEKMLKWKTKIDSPPVGGDRRTRGVFAWRKTQVRGYIVWLEKYQVEEVYFQPAGGNPGWWSEVSRDVIHKGDSQ
jgi:hypothetical protein